MYSIARHKKVDLLMPVVLMLLIGSEWDCVGHSILNKSEEFKILLTAGICKYYYNINKYNRIHF